MKCLRPNLKSQSSATFPQGGGGGSNGNYCHWFNITSRVPWIFFRKLEVYEHEQMKHPKVIISNYLFIHYLKNIANINKIIYDLINVPAYLYSWTSFAWWKRCSLFRYLDIIFRLYTNTFYKSFISNVD